MAERTAHLIDHVFPAVPVRQWVLSLPHRLRYQLAWNHDQCRAVVGVLVRAIFRLLRERARDEGIDGGRSGAVVVIQRFGGALNLNVHVHALVLDGVFARANSGALAFHPIGRVTTLDVAEVLAEVEPAVIRRLRGPGRATDDEDEAADPWTEAAPVLAGLAAASVQGLTAVGPRRGRSSRRIGASIPAEESSAPGACHARGNGFDLHAGLLVPDGHRERLERVCRYALRPPVSAERLHLTPDGQVRLSLRQPWRDGTTALVFDPVEFLGRLAVLVPRPRTNLVLYCGVLGARSAWRAEVVPGTTPLTRMPAEARPAGHGETEPADARRRSGDVRWAALMQRTFGFDVLTCDRCGGRLRLLALIQEPAVIGRILSHLGLPADVPRPRPARAPPDDATRWLACAAGDDEPSAFTPCR